MSGRPVLYFDVGSPFAWLAAERAAGVLGVAPVFQPVLLGGLFKLAGRSSWAIGDPGRREAGILDVEQRAQHYGLPAVRWPRDWPGNYLTAMRVAVWAQGRGAAEAYALAALRRAFTAGCDLGRTEEVRAAAADAGLDGDAALEAAADPGVKLALREATQAAFDRGVFGVPTVAVGDELFWGDDRLEEAAGVVIRKFGRRLRDASSSVATGGDEGRTGGTAEELTGATGGEAPAGCQRTYESGH